jgi:hypothetical protein
MVQVGCPGQLSELAVWVGVPIPCSGLEFRVGCPGRGSNSVFRVGVPIPCSGLRFGVGKSVCFTGIGKNVDFVYLSDIRHSELLLSKKLSSEKSRGADFNFGFPHTKPVCSQSASFFHSVNVRKVLPFGLFKN